MPWAQKDDRAWTDPTLCVLTDRAYRLLDNCWTYSADQLTDGHLTRDAVARVAAMFKLTDPKALSEAITELVTWKLWTEELDGFVMVGWLTQNRSRKRVLKEREKNRKKLAAWRAKMAAQEAAE